MTALSAIELIKSRLDRPITVVGMMGSGKSTLGAALANLLGWSFYDTDRRIEQETGQTISQIFSERGEEAFRNLEQATVRKILDKNEVCVLASGGLLILFIVGAFGYIALTDVPVAQTIVTKDIPTDSLTK